jgi:hypothetical protein
LGPEQLINSRLTNDAREDEMDSNMVQVSNMMSNLKNMGLEMGQEIERQNQVIERVTKKVFDHGQ